MCVRGKRFKVKEPGNLRSTLFIVGLNTRNLMADGWVLYHPLSELVLRDKIIAKYLFVVREQHVQIVNFSKFPDVSHLSPHMKYETV